MQSCDNSYKYGKWTPTEQKEVEDIQGKFEVEFQRFMRNNDIIDNANNKWNNINLWPILIERGPNYSILLSTSWPVWQKTINMMYDDGTVEYSYYCDGMGGYIAWKNTVHWLIDIPSTQELKDIYSKLITLLKQANNTYSNRGLDSETDASDALY